VTGESKGETEPWIKNHEVGYAYAYDKGGKLSRFFGVEGIPHAVLIDASGKVAWRGHPGELDDALLQKHLAGTLPKPMWEWPASAKPVRAALLKLQFAAALAAAEKVPAADGGAELASGIKALIAGRVAAMKSACEAGNFLEAQDLATSLSKSLQDLPEQADAAKVAADIAANPSAPKVLAAQKAVKKIRDADPTKRKDIDQAIEKLREIMSANPGTYVAKDAGALIDVLKARKQR